MGNTTYCFDYMTTSAPLSLSTLVAQDDQRSGRRRAEHAYLRPLAEQASLPAIPVATGTWLEKAGTQTEGAGRCKSTDI